MYKFNMVYSMFILIFSFSHLQTVRQVNEMQQTVYNLQSAIAEKEGFMGLAHTRLGNRCQRANAELCRL